MITHPPPQTQALLNRQGIAAMCLAMAFFLTNDTLVKMASVHIGIFQSLFLLVTIDATAGLSTIQSFAGHEVEDSAITGHTVNFGRPAPLGN